MTFEAIYPPLIGLVTAYLAAGLAVFMTKGAYRIEADETIGDLNLFRLMAVVCAATLPFFMYANTEIGRVLPALVAVLAAAAYSDKKQFFCPDMLMLPLALLSVWYGYVYGGLSLFGNLIPVMIGAAVVFVALHVAFVFAMSKFPSLPVVPPSDIFFFVLPVVWFGTGIWACVAMAGVIVMIFVARLFPAFVIWLSDQELAAEVKAELSGDGKGEAEAGAGPAVPYLALLFPAYWLALMAHMIVEII